MDLTYPLIREWAYARGLLSAEYVGNQSLKAVEELGETFGAFARLPAAKLNNDHEKVKRLMDEISDGLGDTMVVLTIMAAQVGLDIEDCIEAAYEVIKDRTGQMVDGVFVRDI